MKAKETNKWRDNRRGKHDRSAADWGRDFLGWLKRGVEFGYNQNSRIQNREQILETVDSLASKLNISRSSGESELAFAARVRNADTLHRYPQFADHENG